MAGHASHFIDNVEHSTGALGHGLPVALGIALGSLSKGYNNRVFVIVGDGEALLSSDSGWQGMLSSIYPDAIDLLGMAITRYDSGQAVPISSVDLVYLRGADAWQKRKRIRDA